MSERETTDGLYASGYPGSLVAVPFSPPPSPNATTRLGPTPRSDEERARIRLTILSIATVVAVATALYVGGFL
jgi:hypothetical protein